MAGGGQARQINHPPLTCLVHTFLMHGRLLTRVPLFAMAFFWGWFVLPASGLAAGTAPEAAKVQITKRDCRRLARQVNRAGIEYRPGVDVRGRRVESAEVKGARPIVLPEIITFDVKFDIRKFLGKPADQAMVAVGKVEYNIKSGKLTFNGQELAGGEERELAVKCQKILGRAR